MKQKLKRTLNPPCLEKWSNLVGLSVNVLNVSSRRWCKLGCKFINQEPVNSSLHISMYEVLVESFVLLEKFLFCRIGLIWRRQRRSVSVMGTPRARAGVRARPRPSFVWAVFPAVFSGRRRVALSSVLSFPFVPLFLTSLTLLHTDLACHGSQFSFSLLPFVFLLLDLHLSSFFIRLGLLVQCLLHS